MNCLDKARALALHLPPDTSDDELIAWYCPTEFGLKSIESMGEGCRFDQCTECWHREAVMLEAEDIPEEESVPETVEKLQKAGEALSLGYKEGIEENTKWPNNLSWPSPIPTSEEDKPRILDSGNRRQFESGAVRDICEGKGRCDLLPLDVVGHALANPTIAYISQYTREDGDYEHLYRALSSCGIFHDYYTLMLEVAKQFEDGAKKYGDDNWQKGIPTHCYIDSAVRHYLKYLRGDKDEPHDRAFCWNILCCIWTCIHKPELNDYAMKKEEMDG